MRASLFQSSEDGKQEIFYVAKEVIIGQQADTHARIKCRLCICLLKIPHFIFWCDEHYPIFIDNFQGNTKQL